MTQYDSLEVAAYYLALFAGRTDVYQSVPTWGGKLMPVCTHCGAGCPNDHCPDGHVWAPVTAEIAVEAFTSGRAIGFYFLPPPDNLTHVAALDFDGEDGLEQAYAVGTAMADADVPAYVEPSRRGAHVWMTLEHRQPAILVRSALRAAIVAAGLDPADPKIELRPAQDRLAGDESLGFALRAPMMRHPATGKWWPLHDPRTRQPLGQRVPHVLLALDVVPDAAMISLAERWHPPTPDHVTARHRPTPFGTSPIERFNAAVGVSHVLVREWGVLNAAPGRNVCCPAHDDRSPSLSIAREDDRAWCHSPGCILSADGRGHDAYSLWTLAQGRAA